MLCLGTIACIWRCLELRLWRSQARGHDGPEGKCSRDSPKCLEAMTLALDHIFFMLSRRIFRQLTDSVLLESGSNAKPLCVAARCTLCSPCGRANAPRARHASSSSTRWKSRQGNDFFAREARVQGLKSRAAFKLLEVDS